MNKADEYKQIINDLLQNNEYDEKKLKVIMYILLD